MDSFEKCDFGSAGGKHLSFDFGLVGGKSRGSRLLELPVSIMKLRSLSGFLIKSKSGGKGPSSSESGLKVFLLCGERKSR